MEVPRPAHDTAEPFEWLITESNEVSFVDKGVVLI